MRTRGGILILLAVLLGCGKTERKVIVEEEALVDLMADLGPEKLSSYGFFDGPLRDLRPAKNVHFYTINSPLFSDYAFKIRMIRLPEGTRMRYHGTETFEFPEGTVLIKNFFYPADLSKPEGERRLIETRLLVKHEGEWKPLTYVWNEEQTEAILEPAGRTLPVSWTQSKGVVRSIDYSVPNLNQCRGCHLKGDKVMPIGPSARQLNVGSQFDRWTTEGLIEGVPDLPLIPRLANYEDSREPLEARARAWLEINCAHCHRPDGQGKTSGLHLMADVTSPLALGIGKPPVAAGKGSGGRKYSIVPGEPDQSILVYRIESTDPGVMMPEMGRRLVHEEGVTLVREWIQSLK
jgi:uncharacterized repeat protein (TIGR03806 family)